jgi:predicted nicotinamide N-methyase
VLGANVTVSDMEKEISSLTRNIIINNALHSSSKIQVACLDWCAARNQKILPECISVNNYDIILCADLIYELTCDDLAVTILLLLRQNSHAKVLMANANRKHVYLFRRRMSPFCDFTVVDSNNIGGYAGILWCVQVKEDIDWDIVNSSFQ